MKIRFVQTMNDGKVVYRAGSDYEVANQNAIRFIEAGVARKAAEPSEPGHVLPDNQPHPLKADEKIGDKAGLPDAMPVDEPKPAANADNPAAFLHADGTIEPHTGFTTTDPSAETSPPSNGPSPLAYNAGPEAIAK